MHGGHNGHRVWLTRLAPGTLRATVDEYGERVRLVPVKMGRSHDESVNLVVAGALAPEVGDLRGGETEAPALLGNRRDERDRGRFRGRVDYGEGRAIDQRRGLDEELSRCIAKVEHIAYRVVAGDGLRQVRGLERRRRQPVEQYLAVMLGRDEEFAVILTPDDGLGPLVPLQSSGLVAPPTGIFAGSIPAVSAIDAAVY